MKSFKFNLGILALALGLALTFVTSAFKAEPQKQVTTAWFEYKGGDITDPANYMKLDEEPVCNSSGELCSVQATVDGNDPIIDSTLESEINSALSNPSSSHPNVRLFE